MGNYLERIKQVVKDQKEGKHVFIPCSIPYFNRDFTGLGKSEITIITASTSHGKTTFTKFIIFDAIKNAIKYNLKIKFIMFLLEEDADRFEDSLIAFLLFQRFGIRFGTKDFSGRKVTNEGKSIILDQDVIDKIEQISPEIDRYLSYINYYTNIHTPKGIYNKVKEYARDKVLYLKNKLPLAIEQIENGIEFDEFKETEEIIVPVIDHISLCTSEGKSVYETIDELRFYVKHYMESILKCHVVLIQQNSKASGTVDAIKNELYFASIANLADNKSSSNDAYNVITITLPKMFDVKKYRGYDVDKLKTCLAVVFLAKSRYGKTNNKIPFFFDGLVGDYTLLPSVKSETFEEDIQKFYDRVEEFYK